MAFWGLSGTLKENLLVRRHLLKGKSAGSGSVTVIDQVIQELESLNSSTEQDFLAVGEKLAEFRETARRIASEMMELTGDSGAKLLMARHEAQLIEVEVMTDSIFEDVDAPEDLARLKRSGATS